MSDLISRQTAINEISRWLGYLDDDMILRIQMGLRKLPSVQQDVPDINVGRKDLIDRRQAIDALAEQMPTPYTPDGSHPADEGIFAAQEIYADCIETIKLLPSAQPEEAIPVSWIEAIIERFMMTDDAFSGLTASIIRVMLNEWEKEQEGVTT